MDIQVLVRNEETDRETWISVDIYEEDEKSLAEIGLSEEDIENHNFNIVDVDYTDIDFGSTFDVDDTIDDYVELQNLYNDLCGHDQNILDAIMEIKNDINLNSLSELIDFLSSYKLNEWVFYENMSMADVAEEFVDQCYDIPDNIKIYIDFEDMGRDIFSDGGYYEIDEGILYNSNY